MTLGSLLLCLWYAVYIASALRRLRASQYPSSQDNPHDTMLCVSSHAEPCSMHFRTQDGLYVAFLFHRRRHSWSLQRAPSTETTSHAPVFRHALAPTTSVLGGVAKTCMCKVLNQTSPHAFGRLPETHTRQRQLRQLQKTRRAVYAHASIKKAVIISNEILKGLRPCGSSYFPLLHERSRSTSYAHTELGSCPCRGATISSRRTSTRSASSTPNYNRREQATHPTTACPLDHNSNTTKKRSSKKGHPEPTKPDRTASYSNAAVTRHAQPYRARTAHKSIERFHTNQQNEKVTTHTASSTPRRDQVRLQNLHRG